VSPEELIVIEEWIRRGLPSGLPDESEAEGL
jgi:hypothetical protein